MLKIASRQSPPNLTHLQNANLTVHPRRHLRVNELLLPLFIDANEIKVSGIYGAGDIHIKAA